MFKVILGSVLALDSYTHRIMNDFAHYWNETEIEPDFFGRLEKCFAKWNDTQMYNASDANWLGMVQMFHGHQNQSDPWVNCSDPAVHKADPQGRCTQGQDFNWTEAVGGHRYSMIGPQNRSFLALERCNTVSNLAYYRAALRLCEYPDWNMDIASRRALKQSFVTLTTGSALMHMAHTWEGERYDNSMIGVIVYTAYQSIMKKINATDEMLNLGFPNATDSIKLSEAIAHLPLTEDPTQWGVTINYMMQHEYQGDYKRIFGGLIVTILLSTLPNLIARGLIWVLLTAIDSFGTMPGLKQWLEDVYMPDAEKLVNKTYSISSKESGIIFKKFIGTLVKLLWAFAWQEEFMPFFEFMYSRDTLRHFVAGLTPKVNSFASSMNGFPQTDKAMASGKGVYPGSGFCDFDSPHALWHEQSANGFVELMLWADYFYGAIQLKKTY